MRGMKRKEEENLGRRPRATFTLLSHQNEVPTTDHDQTVNSNLASNFERVRPCYSVAPVGVDARGHSALAVAAEVCCDCCTTYWRHWKCCVDNGDALRYSCRQY